MLSKFSSLLKLYTDSTLRPETGLLANLFELPSIEINETEDANKIEKQLKDVFGAKVESIPRYGHSL